MGSGGEQTARSQASLNLEDAVVLPPIPSQDDRSIDPPVSNLHNIAYSTLLKGLVSCFLLNA
jgi:hypothetical protein